MVPTVARLASDVMEVLLEAVILLEVPLVFWLNVGQVKDPVEKFPDPGVPRLGVIKVGELEKRGAPVPDPPEVRVWPEIIRLASIAITKRIFFIVVNFWV